MSVATDEDVATDIEIVGRLNFKGDVRNADRQVVYSEKYGPVVSVMSSYDEGTGLTTVEFARYRP